MSRFILLNEKHYLQGTGFTVHRRAVDKGTVIAFLELYGDGGGTSILTRDRDIFTVVEDFDTVQKLLA